MMKKLMFFAAMVVALFASCSSDDEPVNTGNGTAKTVSLSINADLAAASRVGFTPDGGGLKTSFQEGDYLIAYFRTAKGGWLNKSTILYYDPASANGTKGTFRASNVVIPEGTGLLHILIGTTKGGTPYIDAVAGKCDLIDNLSQQDGTLESAAMHSVFQADIYTENNLAYNKDNTEATLSNVTFKPKTSVVKIDATFPEGVKVEKGTPLTVTTESTYNQVHISGGNPGAKSLPAKAEGEAKFNVKVAEVNGNVATAYMTIWPGVKDDEFAGVNISATINGKIYTGDYTKTKEGKLEAGKLYKMATTLAFTAAETQKIWVNDNEQDVVAVSGTGDTDTDWLTVAGGKIHAKANETGAPRTGTITVDGVPYEITQVEAKDFKGNYTFTTKSFAATGSFIAANDPVSLDVTIGEPRKAVTLTDADGKTKHTNNVGIKGLFFDAVMDAAIEIDYANRTAKMGVFYDARAEEGQLIAANGAAKGKYARFIPALATRTAAAWAKPWKFDETNLGEPNYTWGWFTISADMKTIVYTNRVNNNVEFSTVSQYSSTMNQIVGIDIVLSATNDATATVSGYANVYQTNPKGYAGNIFKRK